MIAFLKGKILNKQLNYLIVLTGQIGYKVFVNNTILSETKIGQEIDIYTYQQIKEDGQALFGFKTAEELEFFELLISVSGVGPKSALNILSLASIEDIKQSIILNDPSLLTKVSGIGQKTAERLVLELKNKIGVLESSFSNSNPAGDEIDALLQLGYSLQQARQALQKVDASIINSGDRIKSALSFIR